MSRSSRTKGWKIVRAIAVWAVVGGTVATPAAAVCTPHWLPGEGMRGIDGDVRVMTTWDPDGPGPRSEVVVVGGRFSLAGDVFAGSIACWDPATSTWSPLGAGISGTGTYTSVYALAVLDGKLYAGGDFTTAGGVNANRIACWDLDTQTWSSLGSGMTGGDSPTVVALAVLDGKLYAGGRFTLAGGVSANGIACWDPPTQTWSALGSGISGTTYASHATAVHALTVLDGKLYAGGSFTTADGAIAMCIACWDPVTSTWSALGSGMGGVDHQAVYALSTLNGKLFAGGYFTTAGGVSANRIAYWDPAVQIWSAAGSGASCNVNDLATLDGTLYALGCFAATGGGTTNRIARWDPTTSTWSPLDSWTDSSSVGALAVLNGTLYAGGSFTTLGGVVANRIACWNAVTSTWATLGTGMSGQRYSSINAMAFLENKLYAGGGFTSAGDTTAKGIACWDPDSQTWSALGSGISGVVSALAVLNGKLYVGGVFASAGGVATNSIACWDPASQTWSALNSGLNGSSADALTVLGGKLYVGGWFTTAGSAPACRIACWDPATQTWSALGTGIGDQYGKETGKGRVYALSALNGKLYASGRFTTAGEVNANHVACWDPVTQTWSALGEGIGGDFPSVYALAVLNGKLYAGGTFDIAGGGGANKIACWNPATSAWSALGSGMTNSVSALTPLDGRLYAGGGFAAAGGVSAWHIACWDPATQTWSPLGSGTNDSVSALSAQNDTLYVGGRFTTAGGLVSAYWGRWQTCVGPAITAAVSRKKHGTAGTFDINVSSASAVESRQLGPNEVLVTFDKDIQRLGGALPDVTVSQGTVTSLAVNGATLDIRLHGTTGPQAMTLSFPGIAANDTGTVVTQTLCFKVLPGDVSGDGTVNTSDFVPVRAHIGQAVDSTNYRCDVNLNGAISSGDYVFIRPQIGTTAGSCP